MDKKEIPPELMKRIEEMAEKFAESKRNYFCSECESFHTTNHYYKAGAQAMYAELAPELERLKSLKDEIKKAVMIGPLSEMEERLNKVFDGIEK